MKNSSDPDPEQSDDPRGDRPSFVELLLQTASETPGGDDFLIWLGGIGVVAVLILLALLASNPVFAFVALAGLGLLLLWRVIRR